MFLNLEDETGMVNVICLPPTYRRSKKVVLDSAALIVSGRLERGDGAINLLATRVERLPIATSTRSRDFR